MSDSNSSKSNNFTHLNEQGQAHMVDVADKSETVRTAKAQAKMRLGRHIVEQIKSQSIGKGDLLATARIAGIQGAKKCSDLVPLCHPLPLSKVTVDIEFSGDDELLIIVLCKTVGKTGVEMEALTGASIAALTVYDMCKALDKGVVIESVKLLEKTGGKSGDWQST
jgi:cyclic pyranopterin phosphate synthase